MGNIRRGVRKGIVLALSAAMTLGLTSTFMGESNEVAAANTSGNPEGWLTKTDLMTGDTSRNMKVYFGKDQDGNAQTWYVLGKDSGIREDNTILFCAGNYGSSEFAADKNDRTYTSAYGTYTDKAVTESVTSLSGSHYGATVTNGVRKTLQDLAVNSVCFSASQQALMNETTVTTYDTINQGHYTTTDKLYLPAAYNRRSTAEGKSTSEIYLGTNEDVSMSRVLVADNFWSRNEEELFGSYPLAIKKSGNDALVTAYNTDMGYTIKPATNINLTDVLFASVAPTSASGNTSTVTPTKTNITSSDPNVLRLKMSKNYTIAYNSFEQKLYSKILDGSCPQDLSYVIQGKDTSGNDVAVEALVNTFTTGRYDVSRFNINWDEPVKVWLEYTADGITYATNPDDTVDTAVNYNITEGANSTWTKDSGKTLTFKGDGELAKFTEVRVDGTAIDAANYTTKSGSTIVTLKADYLNTLSEGEHNLAIYWNDGKASTTFTVAAASVNPNPGTNPGGDNQNPGGDNTGNNGNNGSNGGDNSGNTGANANNGTTIGDNNTWDKNTNTDLVVKPGNTIKEVTEVKIDGTTLDSKDYTLGSDGNITISKDYLKKLSNGNHTLQILGKGANGESLTISAGFVVKNSNALAPKTGETFLPYLWLASVALMLSVLASIVYDLVKAGRKRRA